MSCCSRTLRRCSARIALAAACRVATSWLRGTTTGIIAASAGAKKTVTTETKTLRRRMPARSLPTK